MSNAFALDRRDNVATALAPCSRGEQVKLLGESDHERLVAVEEIRAEHKIALHHIAKDAPIIKYGMPIGHATVEIRAGQWVHLHNCASNYDERSSSLDGDSGAPTDTQYV